VPKSQDAGEDERRWYLGVLLHALNQPLTAVASFAEAAGAALGGDADPLLREAVSSARAEVLRAIVIARELRAVLGERGSVGALDLNAVLSAVAPDLPNEAGVRVRLELDRQLDRAGGRVAGDAWTLRRAVIALVKSAAGPLAAAGDVTAILRSIRVDGGARAEVELIGDPKATVPANGPSPELDPLFGLARGALADLGGELMLDAAAPGMLRYVLLLAPA
jgi:hypothetical protein